MKKCLIVAIVTLILALAVVSPVVAQQPPVGSCPPGFEAVAEPYPHAMDLNGDGWICKVKDFTPSPFVKVEVVVYIDNVIPPAFVP